MKGNTRRPEMSGTKSPLDMLRRAMRNSNTKGKRQTPQTSGTRTEHRRTPLTNAGRDEQENASEHTERSPRSSTRLQRQSRSFQSPFQRVAARSARRAARERDEARLKQTQLLAEQLHYSEATGKTGKKNPRRRSLTGGVLPGTPAPKQKKPRKQRT